MIKQIHSMLDLHFQHRSVSCINSDVGPSPQKFSANATEIQPRTSTNEVLITDVDPLIEYAVKCGMIVRGDKLITRDISSWKPLAHL